MEKQLLHKILLALFIILVLFFGDYSTNTRTNLTLRLKATKNEQEFKKSAADYETLSAEPSMVSYSDQYRTFEYNETAFTVDKKDDESELGTLTIRALEIPDASDANKGTVLLVGTTENTKDYEEYARKGTTSQFLESFTKKLCLRIFKIEDGVEITNDGYNYAGDMVEYYLTLADGTKCFTKTLCFNEVITYVLYRECSYSEFFNPYYYQIYESAAIPGSTADAGAYPAGMYKIGEDISAGIYLIQADTADPTYISVTTDASGSLDSVVMNDNFYNRIYITLEDGHYLSFRDGNAYPLDAAPAYKPADNTYPSGMYLAGKDIPAGSYTITPEDSANNSGYYVIYSTPGSLPNDILTNENITSSVTQELKDGQYIQLKKAQLQ